MNKNKSRKKLLRHIHLIKTPIRTSGSPMASFVNKFKSLDDWYNGPHAERNRILSGNRDHHERICINMCKNLNMSFEELFFLYHQETGYPLVYTKRVKTDYHKMPDSTHRDNKEVVKLGNGWRSNPNKIRVPSLKRSNNTWKNFYKLFPFLKGKETYRGYKLKDIN
jgi:hypothetical protein